MILRVCVVIPYFGNPRTISQVVKEVVLSTPFPIVIVDDGSETPVSHVLYSFEVKEALEAGRIRIVRFEEGRGKGAALQYAIQDLVACGYTHMLTLDGDGLHLPRELTKLVQEACRHPWSMILGRRQGSHRPPSKWRWSSKPGLKLNRLLSHFVKFETGAQIQDPSSGFRLYPLFPLQTMRFRTKGYDFDLEVLIRLLWNRVDVREIPVATAPFDAREHVTHFHRLWDTLRISFLNLILVTLSLLKMHKAPRELAWAVSVGVFVGCLPIFGFHTILVALLAVVLRLNFVALWMGTHVSTPIFYPFLLWAEIQIAQRWLGVGAAPGLMGHFHQLAVGSLVLGLLLAVPAYALTYLASALLLSDGPGQPKFGPSAVLKAVVRFLGVPSGYLYVWALARWRYLTWFRVRFGLNEYYRIVRPALSFWARQMAVVAHLQRVGEIQVDHLAQSGQRTIRPHNRTAPWGLTGHIGSWDLAAPNLSSYHWIEGSPQQRIELIPFLGKLAPMDVSIFRRAAETGVPLMTGFGIKAPDGAYELHARQEREYIFRTDSAPELQVYDWATRFAVQFDAIARKFPDQWSNLYAFFSAQPGPSADSAIILEDIQPR